MIRISTILSVFFIHANIIILLLFYFEKLFSHVGTPVVFYYDVYFSHNGASLAPANKALET